MSTSLGVAPALGHVGVGAGPADASARTTEPSRLVRRRERTAGEGLGEGRACSRGTGYRLLRGLPRPATRTRHRPRRGDLGLAGQSPYWPACSRSTESPAPTARPSAKLRLHRDRQRDGSPTSPTGSSASRWPCSDCRPRAGRPVGPPPADRPASSAAPRTACCPTGSAGDVHRRHGAATRPQRSASRPAPPAASSGPRRWARCSRASSPAWSSRSSATMMLSELGYDVAPIIASAGILGVALGFGAQSLVKDFLSGIFMIFEDQYGVGDVVDVGEASGTVEAVSLRVTRLRDVNGTVWYVRNGEILRVGNMSQNWARTRPRHQRRATARTSPGAAGAAGGRPRPVGGRGLQGPRHRGARGLGRRGPHPRRRRPSGSRSRPPRSSSGRWPARCASGSRPASTYEGIEMPVPAAGGVAPRSADSEPAQPEVDIDAAPTDAGDLPRRRARPTSRRPGPRPAQASAASSVIVVPR